MEKFKRCIYNNVESAYIFIDNYDSENYVKFINDIQSENGDEFKITTIKEADNYINEYCDNLEIH